MICWRQFDHMRCSGIVSAIHWDVRTKISWNTFSYRFPHFQNVPVYAILNYVPPMTSFECWFCLGVLNFNSQDKVNILGKLTKRHFVCICHDSYGGFIATLHICSILRRRVGDRNSWVDKSLIFDTGTTLTKSGIGTHGAERILVLNWCSSVQRIAAHVTTRLTVWRHST